MKAPYMADLTNETEGLILAHANELQRSLQVLMLSPEVEVRMEDSTTTVTLDRYSRLLISLGLTQLQILVAEAKKEAH